MARPKRNWIQEERRNTLGHWVALCPGCGYTQRYFEDSEADLPASCPQCQGPLRRRCPSCDARFASAFQITCEDCGAEVRPNTLFGVPIRKAGR
jgi:RNase P subunit RPR2